jgi:hypothetical protein
MLSGHHRGLAMSLALVLAVPCRGEGLFAEALRLSSPAEWVRQFQANRAAGRHIALDLSTHPTRMAALKRSFTPLDARANIRSAALGHLHPVNIAWMIALPVIVEAQRQAGGKGLNAGEILRQLDPRMLAGSIGGSLVGGMVGAVAGSAAQSALAGLGPVGAAAGFLVRPMIDFMTTVLGMQLGQNLAQGRGFRDALADALLDVSPLRDAGQAMGLSLGFILGQVMIPIPIVGGMIGSTIGGALGAGAGNLLKTIPALGRLDRWISDRLAALAARLRRRSRGKTSARHGVPPASAATAPPRKRPATAAAPSRDRATPGFEDLPVAVR